MTEKTRKWVKSKINVEQVAQNTQNAKQYVEITEKYKKLGSQIESTVDNIFNSLGTNFMKFDPSTTIEEDLERSGQKQAINRVLKYADYAPAHSSLFISDLKTVFSFKQAQELTTLIENEVYQDLLSRPFYDSSLRHELNLKGFLIIKENVAKLLDYYKTGLSPQHYQLIKEWDLKLEVASTATQALLELNDHFNFTVSESYVSSDVFSYIISYYFSYFEAKYKQTQFKQISNALKVYQELLNSENIVHPKITDKEYIKSIVAKLEATVKAITDNAKKNSLAADLKVLKDWSDHIEAKEYFLNATEALHDHYNSFLELDDRTEIKDIGTLEKFADYLKGNLNFFSSSEKPTSEALKGNKEESKGLFQKFFDVFRSSDKTEHVKQALEEDDVEVIELSDSNEIAAPNAQSQIGAAKVVKTVGIEAYESKEQIHHEYQTLMSAFMDAKKAICFNNVMQATKLVSSCLMRKPFEQATNENKFDCEAYDVQAKLGLMQCDYLFPFATKSDDIISEYLNKSSKIEVSIYEDGKTGLKSHIDEVIADLTIALGQAIVGLYKALPADSNQQIMEAAYQAPLDKEQADKGTLQIEGHDQAFPHDNANALVLPTALPAPAQDVL